jgi:hypothetical protein
MGEDTPPLLQKSPASSAEKFGVTEMVAALATLAWLGPVVWMTGRIADQWDDALAMGAVCVLAGWALWKNWPARVAAAARGWQLVFTLGWGGMVWLMAGLRVEDFWLVRAALPAALAAWVIFHWGWSALPFAWRALVAGALWAWAPLTGRLVAWDARGGVSEATAATTEFFLRITGHEALRQGATILQPHGAVTVLTACTGAGLAETLLRLLLPACVALALPCRRAAFAAVAVLPLAFVTASLRATVMARVVDDPVRFEYWHGADGAALFTAVAMALLAALVAWLMPPPEKSLAPEPERRVGRGAWWPLAAVAAACALAATRPVPAGEIAEPVFAPPAPPGWTVRPGAEVALPTIEDGAAARPLRWAREFVYENAALGARVTVRAGGATRWLRGDPVLLAKNYEWLGRNEAPEAWAAVPLAGGAARLRVTPEKISLLAAIAPDGTISATADTWLGRTTALPRDAARWGAWLRGETALRDKRGVWIALEWTSGGAARADEEMSRLLAVWAQLAPRLVSYAPSP